MNKTLYTWQIIKSDSKYNKEAAIYDDNGKIVAICPLDEVEYVVFLKNQWRSGEAEKGGENETN